MYISAKKIFKRFIILTLSNNKPAIKRVTIMQKDPTEAT